MRSGIAKILLPVSLDKNFENAAKFAVALAKDNGAKITGMMIDDDSPGYETTILPFHTKNLNSIEIGSGKSRIPENNDLVNMVLSRSKSDKVDASKKLVGGHAATQVLLQSRYHDVVVMSDRALFPSIHEGLKRRVNPLLEILDQAVIPTILCGDSSAQFPGSAALYFDGSPFATMALHQLAYLYQSSPDRKIVVRVSYDKKSIAEKLTADAVDYLQSKGMRNVESEYSQESPIEFAKSRSGDDTSLVALGIRSRQAFHDFRIGALAHHFFEEEPGRNKLFC
ncbi:MAG: universal stress protein [Verrucomicrobiales bacterium]|nr:universal stress protein [Verrucomicrobiales bacterium]